MIRLRVKFDRIDVALDEIESEILTDWLKTTRVLAAQEMYPRFRDAMVGATVEMTAQEAAALRELLRGVPLEPYVGLGHLATELGLDESLDEIDRKNELDL